jgi:hypothetical protein
LNFLVNQSISDNLYIKQLYMLNKRHTTKLDNGSSTEVEQPPHYLNLKGLSPAFAHPLCCEPKPMFYLMQALYEYIMISIFHLT